MEHPLSSASKTHDNCKVVPLTRSRHTLTTSPSQEHLSKMTLLELGGFIEVWPCTFKHIYILYVSIWVYIKCPKPCSSHLFSKIISWSHHLSPPVKSWWFSDKNQRPQGESRHDWFVLWLIDWLSSRTLHTSKLLKDVFRRILFFNIDGLYVFSLWWQSWSQKALYRKPRGAGARVEKTLLRIRPWQSDKRDADVSKRHGDA